ncbi:uncharacterized protein A4U43_C06F950, partial [Asparagus officinalis]
QCHISTGGDCYTGLSRKNIIRLKDSHKPNEYGIRGEDRLENLADALSDITKELGGGDQELHEKTGQQLWKREELCHDIVDKPGKLSLGLVHHVRSSAKGLSACLMLSACHKCSTAYALAAVRESSNLPVQLDEFGRDVNLQKRMDFSRRAEARKRIRARADSRRMTSIGKQLEGEVTTDESDRESTAYTSTRDELLQTAEQIFSDAADEYSNLSVVKERFERWKKHHFSSYRDAYMSLSAPDVFSPYVRLELLK